MKKTERGAKREKRMTAVLAISTLLVLLSFATLLYFMIVSIDSADGADKSSPGAPESFVSLGAPRSQLELMRMFRSMSAEYTENGRSVFEPVTMSYADSVGERIAAGESLSLSVEEILYIVSDSIVAYDNYDIIRLGDLDVEPIKNLAFTQSPYYASAEVKARDILRIISYRIFSVSSPDRIQSTDGGFLYLPGHREKNDYTGSFFIASADSADISELVVYNTEEGRSVSLYPTDKIADECDSTVISESPRALSGAEKAQLLRAGYDADACRNLTPECFYGNTSVRLVATGGRIIVVDTRNATAFDALSKNEKMMSASCVNGEVYFTSSYEGGSAVLKYESGRIERVKDLSAKYVGIYEDGESLFVYATEKRESKKYISLLVRTGEPIIKLNTQEDDR